MFLRSAKKTGSQTQTPISGGSSSIERSFAILYTLSASGLLAIGIIYLHWVLVADLHKVNTAVLSNRISTLQILLKARPNDHEMLEVEARIESEGYTRILDEMDRIIVETSGMNAILAPSLFPSPPESGKMGNDIEKRVTRDKKTFLLMSAWAKENPQGMRRRIQVALNVSYEEKLKSSYLERLLIVLFAGILSTSVIGVVITRRGLRPLRGISREIGRIKIDDLHKRLQPTEWPNELRPLAIGFNRMLTRLDLSFTRLSQFSSDLAHEFRTPIHNLMGEAEVALSRERTPEAYREVITSSLEETHRLSRMIDHILFLARAETEAQSLQAKQFKAETEITGVLEFYDALAEEEGITLTSSGSALLYADPVLFRRVISNLVSNALQYTPRDGSVFVKIRKSGDAWIEVCVTDTGRGISSEDLPRVFDRFFRAERTRSHFPKGLGLGLSIVKSIMDFHQGQVSIQSEVNKGTMMVLRFPPPPASPT